MSRMQYDAIMQENSRLVHLRRLYKLMTSGEWKVVDVANPTGNMYRVHLLSKDTNLRIDTVWLTTPWNPKL